MSILLLKSDFALDSYSSLGCSPFYGGGSFTVDSLCLLLPLSMGFRVYTTFCPSSFALILMGNRELIASIILLMSFGC